MWKNLYDFLSDIHDVILFLYLYHYYFLKMFVKPVMANTLLYTED